MRISSSRREDDFEINVISLIDVMLTLLMFFVLTTTFVQHSRMKVTLPEAVDQRAVARRQGADHHDRRDGRFYIDNNEVLNPGHRDAQGGDRCGSPATIALGRWSCAPMR